MVISGSGRTLVCFDLDGVRFTPWEALSDTPLPKLPASALCITRDGSLWVDLPTVVESDGFAMDRSALSISHGGVLGSIADLVEDHRGTVWAVVTTRCTESRTDIGPRSICCMTGASPLIQHPFVSSKGELWVGTARSGLFRRVGETDAFGRMTPGFMWGVSEDAEGTIWITDIVAGFRRLGEPSSPPRPLEGSGYRLMHDRHGNPWVATLGEGLRRVRPAENGEQRANPRTPPAFGSSKRRCELACPATPSNLFWKIVRTTSGWARQAACIALRSAR